MRSGGVLMPISSLPSPYGIGTMGKEAREFVDFLEKAGQRYWQILPICPTSYGDSPYQSFSSFAGNPYFIDLTYLCEDGYLTKAECASFDWGESESYVDYGMIYQSRYELLKIAYSRFLKNVPEDYEDFCVSEASWLTEYALFMAIKDANNGCSWLEWDEDLKTRDEDAIAKALVTYHEEIEFYRMLQYLFYKQWGELKEYANSKEILIIGDVPIYVALDSADVWANPTQFYLDEELNPIEVAGCPPDAFSADGQLWGNPLFRWDVMKEDGYRWWIKRVAAMSKLYDVVRIDHFRGFDSYYAIPAEDDTARNGYWKQGPGMDLFTTLEEELGELNIIAEDLGFLTDSVYQLLKDSGFPGMKVLEFGFDTDGTNEYLPHNFQSSKTVVYTGTHDNETAMGWYLNAPEKTKKYVTEYLNLTEQEGINWGIMRGAWASVADLAVVPVQDLLGLCNQSRMNTPSTLGDNWKWRVTEGMLTDALAEKLKHYMVLFGRYHEISTE